MTTSISGTFIYSYISSDTSLPTSFPIRNEDNTFTTLTPSLSIINDRIYISIDYIYSTNRTNHSDGLTMGIITTDNTFILEQFDNIPLLINGYQFYNYLGSFNTNYNVLGSPTILPNTNFEYMFHGAINLNQSLSFLDTSQVINMTGMFAFATSFNQPISHFDTSQVTNMAYMFRDTTSFNQSISNFDTSQVTNMEGMFMGAISFDQSINHFDTNK